MRAQTEHGRRTVASLSAPNAGDGRSHRIDEVEPPPPGLLRPPPRCRCRTFSVLCSTEDNHSSDDMNFYGPFAHIRKTLDYSYHSNYQKERQWLQDSIIEDFLDAVNLTDVNGDVCTTPTEPFIVFTAGAMGAGKSHTINELVKKGRFPLLAFVRVDPDEIRRRLPEFMLYAEKSPEMAGELTRKEAGYVSEILTLAALQAGKNVLVDGSLRDSGWYQTYFKRLRSEYPNLKIAILHIVAPREAVFQRAADRALKTGRVVPRETLEMALEQVPRSVKILAPLADYFCELNNAPGADDIEILTEGEDWDTFQSQWLQTCAWVPGKQKKPFSLRRKIRAKSDTEPKDISPVPSGVRLSRHASLTKEEKKEASAAAIRAALLLPKPMSRKFSVKISTELNYKSGEAIFYGPYSHIRKQLDYSYHSFYDKERQWLQDAIIGDLLKTAELTDVNGDVCTTPTEPWLVFTAGCMGSGKSHTIRELRKKGRFPLVAFVVVDPDEIRRHLPEFTMYVDQCAATTEELTRKEVGYIGEILTLAALQAGKNVLVDGTLRDLDWYQSYITQLRKDFPSLRIAILHIVAPRQAVFQRAARRAIETGRVVPQEVLEVSMEQVPKSVSTLGPQADYVCELRNAPGASDIEIITEGESWDTFQAKWVQVCAWVPGKRSIKSPRRPSSET